jgi:hypothetical protein
MAEGELDELGHTHTFYRSLGFRPVASGFGLSTKSRLPLALPNRASARAQTLGLETTGGRPTQSPAPYAGVGSPCAETIIAAAQLSMNW